MAAKLSQRLLRSVQLAFVATFLEYGTEDRLLIYANQHGELLIKIPALERRKTSVTCDVELTIELNGQLWDLTFDLHSHHLMGAFWSGKDNRNERVRGPIFGVCSWRDGWPPAWLFRRFTGTGFEDLPTEAVVGDV